MSLFAGSKPIPSLLSLPHICFLYLSEPPGIFSKLPFVLAAPLKITHQVATVLAALMVRVYHPPEFIMVQVRYRPYKYISSNNELHERTRLAYQLLRLCGLLVGFAGARLSSTGITLGIVSFAMKLGPDHLFVRIAKRSSLFNINSGDKYLNST